MESYYSKQLEVGDVIKGSEYWRVVNKYISKAPVDIEETTTPHPLHVSPFVNKTYVVIETAFEGGTGYESNGHHVVIQELKQDGTYNPKGRTYAFYQTGNFIALIRECEVVNKLTRKVTFE